MSYADPSECPGDDWTFRWPKRVGLAGTEKFESHVRLAPLAVHDIVERFNEAQKAGRTPKLVFIHRSLWEQLCRMPNVYAKTRWAPRYDCLLGVPVKFTSGKLPFYVVDDKGNKL